MVEGLLCGIVTDMVEGLLCGIVTDMVEGVLCGIVTDMVEGVLCGIVTDILLVVYKLQANFPAITWGAAREIFSSSFLQRAA